ncbi:MAG TPA: SURF1 family cytochrome oxidase biogenesis protein [Pseudonocardiaceae bacterium]|nr:SURF1 family cytochrome oxidase biogenesis protein [Pseudonocardiaceae bacterium]
MRWRFLLRPGWMALTVVVVCFSVAAFTLLAPWQFGRAEQRAERNAAIERSFSIPPQPLREVLAPGAAPAQGTEWRQVLITGRYLPNAETVVRLRTVQGEPAYEVLVPLELADGSTVLVDRGYLRPVEGRVPAYPPVPSSEVTVTGRLRADEPDPHGGEVVAQDGHRQVYAVNTPTVGAVTGLRLEPGYVQLADGAPGVLSALPLPQLYAGPSFAYALQWLAFGTMAPLGLAYFAWREATGWRREEWSPDADDPHDPPMAALADRYGSGKYGSPVGTSTELRPQAPRTVPRPPAR